MHRFPHFLPKKGEEHLTPQRSGHTNTAGSPSEHRRFDRPEASSRFGQADDRWTSGDDVARDGHWRDGLEDGCSFADQHGFDMVNYPAT